MLYEIALVDHAHLEQLEGTSYVDRRCVEHAGDRELRVMQKRRIDGELAARLRPAEQQHKSALASHETARFPHADKACRLDDNIRPASTWRARPHSLNGVINPGKVEHSVRSHAARDIQALFH